LLTAIQKTRRPQSLCLCGSAGDAADATSFACAFTAKKIRGEEKIFPPSGTRRRVVQLSGFSG
jgi:hypothetical protein